MTKFLHIADIHLGTNQYNSPGNTRKKDFFHSFADVIDRYAIEEQVDFVIIAGDLFDKSRIDPNTLNQAILVLKELKENNIPVFAIEGNHDAPWGSDSVSWLQFLGEQNYINFLRPDPEETEMTFTLKNEENSLCGCYKINNQIRIIGTGWYGANTANAIPEIAEAVKNLGDYPYTILMLHAGLEGYLAGYGTISKASLEPLKGPVDYIALGHIHKHYVYDNRAFNPGSLEACCIPEYFDPHGALLVEVDQQNNTKYQLITNYKKREFIRIKADISRCYTPDEALEKIECLIEDYKNDYHDKPVVEVVIDGTLEFKRSELSLESVKSMTMNHLDALLVLVKYFARPKEYAVGANLSVKSNRQQIEHTVIRDMLSSYQDYKAKNDEAANTVINLKNMVLNSETSENIFNYLESNLMKSANSDENS